MFKEKISVFVDGVLTKICDSILEALIYVHSNALGHKIQFKCEKINA